MKTENPRYGQTVLTAKKRGEREVGKKNLNKLLAYLEKQKEIDNKK